MLKTYKQRVRQILEKYEKARDNDGILTAYYIATYHPTLLRKDTDGNSCVPLKYFGELPPLENIRRSRQLIQNDDGEFLPTKESIRKARKIKEKNWREVEVREAKLI